MKELMKLAEKAYENSYSPYSGIRIGAAVNIRKRKSIYRNKCGKCIIWSNNMCRKICNNFSNICR